MATGAANLIRNFVTSTFFEVIAIANASERQRVALRPHTYIRTIDRTEALRAVSQIEAVVIATLRATLYKTNSLSMWDPVRAIPPERLWPPTQKSVSGNNECMTTTLSGLIEEWRRLSSNSTPPWSTLRQNLRSSPLAHGCSAHVSAARGTRHPIESREAIRLR